MRKASVSKVFNTERRAERRAERHAERCVEPPYVEHPYTEPS